MLRIVVLVFASLLVAQVRVPRAEAQSDVASDSEARALFSQGREAYDAERFEDAARAFRRAYLLSPRYALLYNIGQSELRAGNDALALAAFEGFLRQAPSDDPHRSEVEERARILRSMGVTAAPIAVEAAPAETASSPEETTTTTVTTSTDETTTAPIEVADEALVVPPSDEGPGMAPWILVGGGVAVLIAGGVLMGVGGSEASRVTGAADGSRWADLQGAADSANVMWGVGIGLAAVGLAAAGVGLVWALTGGSSSSGEATARLRVGPMGMTLEGEL
ncbi:MAG: tetratricopeptide repeat protein [Myxococcota bacterium]|nr:tetratricopeptide repeat protein [Myxococcota bacterium]